jgi:acetyl-CoA acetyltransferase
MRNVYVLGVGVHPFGKFEEKSHLDLMIDASVKALKDAGIEWKDLQAISASSAIYGGGFGSGIHGNEFAQAVVEMGGPIYNVSAGCATGGVALSCGYFLIASGQCDLILVVGGEKMPSGFLPRPSRSLGDQIDSDYLRWVLMGASNPVYWALECRRRMEEYGTTERTLAMVSVQAHRIAVHNPYARYHKEFTLDEVLNSPMVVDPFHLYEICPVSDGAAAVVLSSAKEARKRTAKPVKLAACTVASRAFGDPQILVGQLSTPSKASAPYMSEVVGAVKKAYEIAGVGPGDIDLIELADNSSWQQLAWPELFDFFQPGQSDWMLEKGETDIDGKLPINPSGGFLSFGEATAAMGIWQVCENIWQLRGEAGKRQVKRARVALSVALGYMGHGAAAILIR